jgi:hypothetical protein
MTSDFKKILKKIYTNITKEPQISPLVKKITHLDQINSVSGKFLVQSFGDENPDLIFYIIARSPGSGFFSNLNYVLNHLKIAESLRVIPIVDMENFPTLYNEKYADLLPPNIRGITNSWEYYFKQVSPYTLDEVYESKFCIITDGIWPNNMTMSASSDPDLLRIYNKYIKLESQIDSYISKFYKEKFKDNKVLGIHFRGQEMKTAGSHPLPPTPEQIIGRAHKLIRDHQFNVIFVATEEQAYLDMLKSEFSDMICHTDYYRTYDRNAYAMYPRENHRYLLGKEVLQDMILLSRCDHMLCGGSNVSDLASLVGNIRDSRLSRIQNKSNSSNPIISRYLWNIKRYLPEMLGGFSRI